MLNEVCLIQQFHDQFSQICPFSPWPSILLCDLSSRASLAFSALGNDRNHFLVSFSHRNIIQTSESIEYIIRSCRDNTFCTTAIFQGKYNELLHPLERIVSVMYCTVGPC